MYIYIYICIALDSDIAPRIRHYALYPDAPMSYPSTCARTFCETHRKL